MARETTLLVPSNATFALHGDLVSEFPFSLDLQSRGPLVRIANLEGPILSHKGSREPSIKAGPSLFSTRDAFDFLDNSEDTWIFTLANNHAMDFGWEALDETARFLLSKGAHVVGAGKDENEARQPLTILAGEESIVIIACSGRSFGCASIVDSGIAEVGPWVNEAISRYAESGSQVMVLVHSGTEDHAIPSPRLRELMLSWSALGARICVATHPHTPGPIEDLESGSLVHGLGNFVVDFDHWNQRSSLGLIGRTIELTPSLRLERESLTEITASSDLRMLCVREATPTELVQELRRLLRVLDLVLNNDESYLSLWQSYATHFYENFAKRQLIRGAALLALKPFLSRIVGRNSRYLRPYLHDLLAWDVNAELLLTGLGLEMGLASDKRTVESQQLVNEFLVLGEMRER